MERTLSWLNNSCFLFVCSWEWIGASAGSAYDQVYRFEVEIRTIIICPEMDHVTALSLTCFKCVCVCVSECDCIAVGDSLHQQLIVADLCDVWLERLLWQLIGDHGVKDRTRWAAQRQTLLKTSGFRVGIFTLSWPNSVLTWFNEKSGTLVTVEISSVHLACFSLGSINPFCCWFKDFWCILWQ